MQKEVVQASVYFQTTLKFLRGPLAPAHKDPEIHHRSAPIAAMACWAPTAFSSPGVTIVQLTREKEALLTPIALMLVTVAAVSATGSAFPLCTEGLLRAGFITMPLKPRGDDAVFP